MKPMPMGNGRAQRLVRVPVVRVPAFPTVSFSVGGRRCRAAFSLVELLVVIAILALLVGLMLPAITKTIEGASRNRCGAKTMKLALGMASYNSRQGFFPGIRNPLAIKSPDGSPIGGPALSNSTSGSPRLVAGAYAMPASDASWFLMILPHVGLTNLYNDSVDGKIWFGAGGTGTTSHSRINQDLTFCPSRVDHYNIANGGVNMHYKANGAGAGGSFNRNDGAIGDNSNGIFVSLSDVVAGDGAANTLLIAEGKRDRWMPNTWSWFTGGPPPGWINYGTFVHVGGNNNVANPRVIHPDPGGNLLFGFTPSGAVVATTPIVNTQQPLFPTNLEQSFANASAAVHPGGANVAFVDGSWRFLRQDLPPHIYGHLLTHRSVWDGSTSLYSTNSARANEFLKCPPAPMPYTPKPEDY